MRERVPRRHDAIQRTNRVGARWNTVEDTPRASDLAGTGSVRLIRTLAHWLKQSTRDLETGPLPTFNRSAEGIKVFLDNVPSASSRDGMPERRRIGTALAEEPNREAADDERCLEVFAVAEVHPR